MTAAYYRRKAADFRRRAEAAASEAERIHFADEAARWAERADAAEAQAEDRLTPGPRGSGSTGSS